MQEYENRRESIWDVKRQGWLVQIEEGVSQKEVELEEEGDDQSGEDWTETCSISTHCLVIEDKWQTIVNIDCWNLHEKKDQED